jgi:hypothetical protein
MGCGKPSFFQRLMVIELMLPSFSARTLGSGHTLHLVGKRCAAQYSHVEIDFAGNSSASFFQLLVALSNYSTDSFNAIAGIASHYL